MSAIAQKCLLAANWKMNPTTAGEAGDLIGGISEAAKTRSRHVEVVVCPPFPWLLGVAELLDGSGIELGAQDCYWERSGAYTGAVSAAMLAGWCQWTIVGHSERRLHFGETDQQVAKKAAAVLEAGLEVIVCVGELLDHYEAGETERIVTEQVHASLAECSADDAGRLVVAYEPVWAIGSGKSADAEHAYKTMRLIRKVVSEMLGTGAGRRLRILYGGSVNASNVESYVELPLCDGCLVGGASLKTDEFTRMIEVAAGVYGHGR